MKTLKYVSWFLGIETLFLEIVWCILLWFGIHQGGVGIWCGWVVCTAVTVGASVAFVESLCDLNGYKDDE